jgi:hypothetical protein
VDHVIKPFDVEDLRDVIQRQLALREAPPEAGEGTAGEAPSS